MALQRNERYPGRFDNPSANNPQGAFKNRTSPSAQDGSYLEKDWANDWSGFFERLLTVAGITPNGNVDTAVSSQYFEGLIAAVKANLGNAALRTVGNTAGSTQIPDMTFFPAILGPNGYVKLPNGIYICFGSTTVNSTGAGVVGTKSVSLPVTFPTALTTALGIMGTVDPTQRFIGVNANLTTTSQVTFSYSTATNNTVYWLAMGY